MRRTSMKIRTRRRPRVNLVDPVGTGQKRLDVSTRRRAHAYETQPGSVEAVCLDLDLVRHGRAPGRAVGVGTNRGPALRLLDEQVVRSAPLERNAEKLELFLGLNAPA